MTDDKKDKTNKRRNEDTERGLLIKLMTVTPDQARAWLENNTRNRTLRGDVVQRYARDMLAGTWVDSGQGSIAFGQDGALVDGQHRLRAVVYANKPVKLYVRLTPLTTEEERYIDQGAKRSVTDIMHLSYGQKDYDQNIGAIITMAWEKGERLTISEREKIYDKYKDSVLFPLIKAKKTLPKCCRSTSVLSALLMAHLAENPSIRLPMTVINDFIEVLRTHSCIIGEPQGETVLNLKRWLEANCGSRTHAHRRESLNRTQNALYNYSKGKSLTYSRASDKLRYPKLTII